VGELGVDRDADDFDAALLEFVQAVIEGDQLGRADEGEVERVEKQNNILALEIGQLQRLDFIVAINGGCGEIGGLLANENGHVSFFFCPRRRWHFARHVAADRIADPDCRARFAAHGSRGAALLHAGPAPRISHVRCLHRPRLVAVLCFLGSDAAPAVFPDRPPGWANRQRAALNFFLYTLGGSVFMLVALLFLYDAAPGHSFAMADMAEGGRSLPLQTQLLIFAGLFIGFGVKMPVFPLHGWLPLAHVEAPSPVSILLSGVLLKMGATA
jgi:hypothetical protein